VPHMIGSTMVRRLVEQNPSDSASAPRCHRPSSRWKLLGICRGRRLLPASGAIFIRILRHPHWSYQAPFQANAMFSATVRSRRGRRTERPWSPAAHFASRFLEFGTSLSIDENLPRVRFRKPVICVTKRNLPTPLRPMITQVSPRLTEATDRAPGAREASCTPRELEVVDGSFFLHGRSASRIRRASS